MGVLDKYMNTSLDKYLKPDAEVYTPPTIKAQTAPQPTRTQQDVTDAMAQASLNQRVQPLTTPKLFDKNKDIKGVVRYMTDAGYKKQTDAQALRAGAGSGLDYSKLDYLEPAERGKLLNYALGEDWQSAQSYYNSIQPALNERQMQKVTSTAEQVSRDYPALGVAANIGTAYSKPAAYASTLGQNLRNVFTGRNDPLDTNTRAFTGAQVEAATRQGLTGDIKSPTGKFLADTALSLGQFAATLPLGKTGALATQATGAAGATALDAANRGASAGQALASATLAGAIEAITEKIPLDNLFKVGDVRTFKTVLRNAAKQAGIEGAEEIVNQYANTVADNLVMGDKSQFSMLVNSYEAQGLTRDEAYIKAVVDTYVKQPLLAGAGGAISGGLVSGGMSAANYTPSSLSKYLKPEYQDTALNQASNTTVTPQNAPQATPPAPAIQTPAPTATQPQASVAPQTTPEGMGAASARFDPVNRLVEQYGAIEPGEGLVTTERVVELPKKTSDNLNLSQTVRTVMEAQATTNETAEQIEQATLNEQFSYEVNTDKGAVQRARDAVEYKGYETALRDWTAEMRQGKTSKDLTALGWTLYDNAANSGNVKQAVEILTDIVNNVRASAQTVQAVRLLKKMQPESQLYSVQRSVRSLQDELIKKYGDKAPNLQINDADAQEYLDALKAKDDAKAKNAIEKIYKSIAAQVPSTFVDKWNAWRYTAMLFNPITHIKNIVGNYTFRAERAIKNVIATTIESGTQRLGGNIERTRSILTMKDRALVKSALDDFNNVADEIFKIGKYDNVENKIMDYRTIFKNKVLEKLRKANTTALETEDSWVAKPAYANALAGYLKANNTTLKTNNTALLDRARAFAILEAQKASYRDSNAFSDFVAKLGAGRFSNSTPGKGANVLLEGVLPFKRTPANILVRGVEYSPLGLARTLLVDTYRLKSGEINSGQFIDNISSGLVGTGLMALGMLLASWGVISVGSTGDDKQDKFDQTQGKQAFALNIGGTTYTIDWLAPANMPLFIGVSLYNKLTDKSDKGVTFNDALKIASDISDPLLETSMLQSLNDYLEGFGFAKQQDENLIWYGISQAALSYLGQAVPTIFGRINRTIDPTRRTIFTDPQSGVPTDLQYFAGQQLNKIPFASTLNQPFVDQWGNQQNSNFGFRFVQNWLSPGYAKQVKTSPMEQELQRLYYNYAKENSVNVLPPSSIKKYFSNNGENVYMNADEYTQYKTELGQYAYSELTKLTGSADYKKLSDEDKAEAISDVWSQAAERAKTGIMDARGEMRIPSVDDGEKIQSYVGLGLSEKQAYSLYQALEGKSERYDQISTILSQGLTQNQKVSVVASLYSSETENGTKESLLPDLNQSTHLLSLYRTTKDAELISMVVPYEFTANKETYTLTAQEKKLFKETYLKIFNERITSMSTAEQVKKIRDTAYQAAKAAVLRGR